MTKLLYKHTETLFHIHNEMLSFEKRRKVKNSKRVSILLKANLPTLPMLHIPFKPSISQKANNIISMMIMCVHCYCFFYPIYPGVSCEYQNGLPVVLVPLPSRRERCQFTLKPVTETVGDFVNHLKLEDGGVDRAGIYNEGTLVASVRL